MTMQRPPLVAVIGCGYWGKNLVRNFAALGALTAVYDPHPATADRMADEYGVPARTLDAILDDRAVEAVAIAAPAAQHYQLSDRALRAAKHVFVEKPLALDVHEAERLTALAADTSRTLMVGHLLQYHPAFLRLKELVAEGALGRVEYLYSNRLNLGRFRREENILWSFAPHDISMILSLVGAEPDHVYAVGSMYLHDQVADVTTTHLAFPGGERAHVFVSWLHPFKEQKLVVVGSDGMAVFDDGEPWASKLLLYPHRIQWRDGAPEPVKGIAESVPLREAEPLQDECRHFLECVATGTIPRTDGWEATRVLRVLAAAEQSMVTGTDRASTPERRVTSDVMVHESAYVDGGAEIGAGTKVWHFSHVMAGTTVGRDCSIGQNVVLGPNVRIGDRCKIQNNVSVYEGVTLGDGVFCGPSCVFTNVMYPRAEIDRRGEFLPTVVGDGVTIGANASIVCGTNLGSYCFVAAGAVVTSDVAPHALVAGVPARRVGWVGHAGEPLDDALVCPRTGRHYELTGNDTLVERVERDN